MACPATTYYRSVQARGVLRSIDDIETKARVLQAFMEHQQPEAGHRPITPEDRSYTKELAAVQVFGLEVEHIAGKESLGQDREPARTRRVVEGLWRRGAAGDARAIRIIVDRSPAACPDWLRAPPLWHDAGVRFVVWPTPAELDQLPRLLQGRYWQQQATPAAMRVAHERSSAWVGAIDQHGVLLAVARALSDGTSRGAIYDVVVDEPLQGGGLGRALVQLLLDHPVLRTCEQVTLGTRDRMRFYEHFGFRNIAPRVPGCEQSVMMAKTRAAQ
jgi:GNAT superfamily N-acetyltransferase